MSTDLTKLSQEIELIKDRNRLVEINKKWETSLTRRLLIALLTYAVMATFMLTIDVEKPLVNAVIPTLGFILSTISLNLFKNIWIRFISK